jgi:dTDP-4-dehydrorhamnose reductase
MKVLILGGDGMLGHQLLITLSAKHDVRVTLRQDFGSYRRTSLFQPTNSFPAVDVRVMDRLLSVLSSFRPDAVVNAAGIVKQRPDGLDIIPNLEVNALLPHRLALICGATGARLIHISTDCVFSGRRGQYTEDDSPDPVDIYGHSKLLGEVSQAGAITLRTSIIGLALFHNTSLIDWFLRQTGTILGYRKAIFSGFTTKELARVIETLLTKHHDASGLYHMSSSPISKYDLLIGLRERLQRDIHIEPDDEVRIDRSLDSSRFRAEFGYTPPTWDAMLDELAGDIQARQQ